VGGYGLDLPDIRWVSVAACNKHLGSVERWGISQIAERVTSKRTRVYPSVCGLAQVTIRLCGISTKFGIEVEKVYISWKWAQWRTI